MNLLQLTCLDEVTKWTCATVLERPPSPLFDLADVIVTSTPCKGRTRLRGYVTVSLRAWGTTRRVLYADLSSPLQTRIGFRSVETALQVFLYCVTSTVLLLSSLCEQISTYNLINEFSLYDSDYCDLSLLTVIQLASTLILVNLLAVFDYRYLLWKYGLLLFLENVCIVFLLFASILI